MCVWGGRVVVTIESDENGTNIEPGGHQKLVGNSGDMHKFEWTHERSAV